MKTNRLGPIGLLEILKEYSDEQHPLSMQELIQKMQAIYDCKVDRRTVYSIMELLNSIGYDISTYQEDHRGYYLRDRDFEVAEVRLLMDSVYSNQTISTTQTKRLIDKLRGLLNVHSRKNYKNLTVIKTDRKTTNQQTFLNIEVLDEAIRQKKQVDFVYLEYDFDKTLKPRREKKYRRNPYQMIVTNEHYYLVCKKSGAEKAALYRLDRMQNVTVSDTPIDTPLSEAELQSIKEQSIYAWSGAPETVILRCKNHVLGDVIDKFGQNIIIEKESDDTFLATLRVAPQGVAFWALQYLSNVEVLSPVSVRDSIIETLKNNPYLKEEEK